MTHYSLGTMNEKKFSDGIIIREICPIDMPATMGLRHNIYLGDWRIAVKGPVGDGQVDLAPEGDLTVRWPPQVERIRLEQNMDLNGLLPSPSGYEVTLRIELSQRAGTASPLEWASILASDPGSSTSFLFVHSFAFVEEPSAKGIILRAKAWIDPFDPNRIYQFCLQFQPDGGHVTLHDIMMRAVPGERKEDAAISAPESAATTALLPAPLPTARRKAVVIAWDMGHNPVGRAFLIADMLARDHDVELIGPLFDKYGQDVWAPIRQSPLPVRTFSATTMDDFLARASAFVAETRPDVVIACKARLPAILLALLIKHRTACPVLIDVDDHELSFFSDRTLVPLAHLLRAPSAFADLDLPYGESWTRMCETLVPLFDGVITSNAALQDRFGGLVVRHARDEKRFRHDQAVRDQARKRFGITARDRVILFLGTPRAHKGIVRIAEALDRLRDPSLLLCIVGTSSDRRLDQMLEELIHARITRFPDQPWDQLNALINMADGVCLLQDSDSPVAAYQIPAKLSEALATGVPVAVTPVAPFRDIPAPHIVIPIHDDADLDGFLKDVSVGTFDTEEHRTRARQYFVGELSYAVNAARLSALVDAALDRPAQWHRDWSSLLHFLGTRWKKPLPYRRPEWAGGNLTFPALTRGATFDLAYFWKQNDTGIYGRRHDMILKYLARHPRVGRIVQFDAPMAPKDFAAKVRLDADAGLDQGNLVVANSIRRFLKIADDGDMARRVFVHRGNRPKANLLGQDLPGIKDYPYWVEQQVRETLGSGPVVSWVAPIARAYPLVHDYMEFSLTVADLIDDQRAMAEGPALQRVHDAYGETIDRADLILANCQSLKDAFAFAGRDIAVIPNAAERIRWPRKIVRPPALASLGGPIVGYVGNLRERIDIDLIGQMAARHPEWHIVLIGSAHGKTEVLTLRRHANVHFLGVKPYEEALSYICAFDVAIMPHLDNAVSQFMNPLKLYVYLSAGVPIVTSAVSNIDDVAPFATVARDGQDFIAQVEAILARDGEVRVAPQVPAALYWDARIDAMVKAIDALL